MPIIGMTDRTASFPIIATIRKGAPKREGERRPGQDLKWFRFVPREGEEDAGAAFLRAYGGQPTTIHIRLPFPKAEDNFSAWKEIWTASALQHRCDGRHVFMERNAAGEMIHTPTVVTVNQSTGEKIEIPKACPGGCKQVGRLSMIVPELERLALVIAMTTSVYDILALSENVKAIEALRGDCRGLPLTLCRRPRMISTPEIDKAGHRTGKRKRMEKWLLTLEVDPEVVSRLIGAMQNMALPADSETLNPPAREAIQDRSHARSERPDHNADLTVVDSQWTASDLDIRPGDDDDEDTDTASGENGSTEETAVTPTTGAPPAPADRPLRAATISAEAVGLWEAAVQGLATEKIGFRLENGKPNLQKAAVTALAIGFGTVTRTNMAQVITALRNSIK